MKERRTAPRRRTCEYHLLYDQDTGELIGRLTNLTSSGLCLITPEAVPVPQLLHCRLRIPDQTAGMREIFFEIESRWTKYNRVCDWHESGFEFTNLPELARSAIAQLIRDWPQESPHPTSTPS